MAKREGDLRKIALIGCAALCLSGPAAIAMPRTLNEPSRATVERDVASFQHDKIPYEAKQDEHWWVAYSLIRNNDFKCYRLTLMIQNKDGSKKVVAPVVEVLDAQGATISVSSAQGVLAMASAMAGAPIPSAPPAVYQTYTGTARSWQTGETYSVTATPNNGGFWGGVAAGIARAQQQAAMARVESGLEMMRWVNAFWMRSPLAFEPKGYQHAALLLDGPNDRPLPIKVRVKIEDSEFEFVTRDH